MSWVSCRGPGLQPGRSGHWPQAWPSQIMHTCKIPPTVSRMQACVRGLVARKGGDGGDHTGLADSPGTTLHPGTSSGLTQPVGTLPGPPQPPPVLISLSYLTSGLLSPSPAQQTWRLVPRWLSHLGNQAFAQWANLPFAPWVGIGEGRGGGMSPAPASPQMAVWPYAMRCAPGSAMGLLTPLKGHSEAGLCTTPLTSSWLP